MFEILMLFALASVVFGQFLPPQPTEKQNRRQKRRLDRASKVIHQAGSGRAANAGACKEAAVKRSCPSMPRAQGAAPALLRPGFWRRIMTSPVPVLKITLRPALPPRSAPAIGIFISASWVWARAMLRSPT